MGDVIEVTTPVSFGRRLTDLADQQGDAPAVIFAASSGDTVELSYRELESAANRTARRLAELGIGADSMVVLALPSSIQHIVLTWASWKLGACVLPLRWDLPAWERERVLAVAAADLVVGAWTEPGVAARAVHPDELAADGYDDSPLPDVVPSPARAIATSGSTGTPKVIVANVPGEGVPGLSMHNASSAYLGHHAGQVQLVPAPLYHTNGFLILHTSMFEGHSIVLMERFEAQRALELIERHRVNTFVAVTIMLQRMARILDDRRYDLSSIESVLHGGAPLPHWLARRWIELVGPEHFFLAYGSSENVGAVMGRGDEWLARPGTVGKAFSTEIKILDPAGNELPPGEVGEIHMRWVGRPAASFGYRGGEAVQRRGEFTSIGDLGSLDADGFLFLADRRTDLIISGGANVYAAEVEAAISEHPSVADVIVIGLPDDEWGQRVHAVVELDRTRPAVGADELRQHASARLAHYKVPKTLEFVERLERTDAGKIRRSAYLVDRT